MNLTTMRNGQYSAEIRQANDGFSLFKSENGLLVAEIHGLLWEHAHKVALAWVNQSPSYEQVANAACIAAMVDDGYNGHKTKIKLSLVNGVWYEVSETGYYIAPELWADRYSDMHQIHQK